MSRANVTHDLPQARRQIDLIDLSGAFAAPNQAAEAVKAPEYQTSKVDQIRFYDSQPAPPDDQAILADSERP